MRHRDEQMEWLRHHAIGGPASGACLWALQEIERLDAERERLRKKIRLLHDATIVLRNGMGGHEHWDRTMRHGAGCAVCFKQREAVDEANRLIEEAGKLEGLAE